MSIFGYCSFGVAYILVFAFASLRKERKHQIPESSETKRFAILIPCYMEDQVILESANHAYSQSYPKEAFDVFVLADTLQPSTMKKLKENGVSVIPINIPGRTKAKALKFAMNRIPQDYDNVVILDADNIVHESFLEKLNAYCKLGYKVIQARRKAKNQNNSYAVLDACSEEINNSIFRKGHVKLGLSASLIGSGMAFDFHTFKSFINQAKAIGGFDKELELNLLKEGTRIHYAEDITVLDEKVQSGKVLYNQRKRWLSAQFFYFRKHILPALRKAVINGNFDYLDKALQMALPPRILLIGVLPLMLLGSLIVPVGPTWIAWLSLILICAIALITALPSYLWNKSSLRALGHIPKTFGIFTKALLHLRGANNAFIHTPHTYQKND